MRTKASLLRKAKTSLPSFDKWLRRRGGIAEVVRMYGTDMGEEFYSEIEQMGSDFQDLSEEAQQKQIQEWAYDKLEAKYEHFSWEHHKRGDRLELFRALTLTDIRQVQVQDFGIFWSWDEEAAEAHWGSFAEGQETYVFRGEVAANEVDWDRTLFHNLDFSIGESEKEITLKPGASVEITGWTKGKARGNVQWQAPQPAFKTVTASGNYESAWKPVEDVLPGDLVMRPGPVFRITQIRRENDEYVLLGENGIVRRFGAGDELAVDRPKRKRANGPGGVKWGTTTTHSIRLLDKDIDEFEFSKTAAADYNRDAYKTPRDEYRGKYKEDETEEDSRARSHRGMEWSQSALAALSTGAIKPEEMKDGYFNSVKAEDFEPLPSPLYHVTTAASKVRSGGILTRYEINLGEGAGLGGGDDMSISFTTDYAIAEAIYDSLLLAREVARGDITIEDMISEATTGAGADKPYIEEFWKNVNAIVGGGERHLQAWAKGIVSEFFTFGDPKGDYAWEPDLEASHWTGGDGKERYTTWKRPMSPDELGRARWQAMKAFLSARESAGGGIDPLFYMTDTAKLAQVPEEDIAILEYRPKPGAMGTQVRALGEWRVYTGDAVELVSEGKPKTAAVEDFPGLTFDVSGSLAAFMAMAMNSEQQQVGVIRCVEFDPENPDNIEDPFDHDIEFGDDWYSPEESASHGHDFAVYEAQVEPEWLGKGLGQTLYDLVIRGAKERGAKYLWSDESLSGDGKAAWERLAKRYKVEGPIRDLNRQRLSLDQVKTAATELPYWDGEGRNGEFPGYEPGGRLSKIRMEPITKLRPTEESFSEEVVQSLMEELLHGEEDVPAIIVQEDWEGNYDIIDGHHRYEAAKRLGYTEVPVREWMDPDQVAEMRKEKTAKDFGYSHYNNREEDLAKLEWEVWNSGSGFTVNAYETQAARYEDPLREGIVSAGKISILKRVKGVAEVYDPYVEHRWKGTGLGQMLYDRAIEEAKKRKFQVFCSDTPENRSGDADSAWNRLRKRYPVRVGAEGQFIIDLNQVQPKTAAKQYPGAEIIATKGRFAIYLAKTPEAMEALSKGTNWTTGYDWYAKEHAEEGGDPVYFFYVDDLPYAQMSPEHHSLIDKRSQDMAVETKGYSVIKPEHEFLAGFIGVMRQTPHAGDFKNILTLPEAIEKFKGSWELTSILDDLDFTDTLTYADDILATGDVDAIVRVMKEMVAPWEEAERFFEADPSRFEADSSNINPLISYCVKARNSPWSALEPAIRTSGLYADFRAYAKLGVNVEEGMTQENWREWMISDFTDAFELGINDAQPDQFLVDYLKGDWGTIQRRYNSCPPAIQKAFVQMWRAYCKKFEISF